MTRIHRQDVLRYLNIRPGQLRAWEQKGLAPRRESYSLEDYGRLRTLRDLSAARFSSSSISASLGAMRKVAGMENPLLEARPVMDGSRVHFRYRGSVTEPIARQFVFDFEPERSITASPGGNSSTFEIHQAGREGRVSAMFLEAIAHEDASRLEEAAQVYERILESNADHAPTCINLGTICYNRRQFTRAEQLYRRATQADPDYALAFFDLGNALDELKRLPDAITAYRSAIRLVPTYADAHYNLALAYERTAERRLALRHWTAYLKLDTSSRWAAHARKQVRRILDREGLSIVHRSTRTASPRSARRNETLGTPVLTAV